MALKNQETGCLSIWQQSVQGAERPILPGNMETDIVVIGGGLTGILTAYYLQQSGRECVVLEADHIGSGQTAHTTAKVTSQHNLIYQKLCRTMGKERAAQYADANENAIRRYKELIDNRSVCLNSFKYNLEYIMKSEKGFNFSDYYNSTPFSDNSVKITSNTIDYTIKTIKGIL